MRWWLLPTAGGAVLVLVGLLVLASQGGDSKPGHDRERPSSGVTSVEPCHERQRPQPAAPPAATPPGSARRADDFVNSIGVNVHLGYTDTPYGDHRRIEDKLRELGVRYVRDGAAQGRPAVYEAMRGLASCGIGVNLIVGDPLRRFGSGTLEQQLALIKKELRGAVVSLEAPNEFDNQGYDNWLPVIRDYQRRLYESAKSDPVLERLPVVGPSFVDWANQRRLGDISRWLDQGNMHSYPSGREPDLDSHLREQLGAAEVSSGSKPVEATETGYHNAVNVPASFGHRPASEKAAGVYMPRLYLDYFRRGIVRTFAYELIDEHPDPGHVNSESSFGLLRNDLSEKPAFVSLKRLIALLRDPGPSFKPGRLRYTISGPSSDLRRLLLEKRDGSFYLALWQADSVWDPAKATPLDPAGRELRLELAQPARIELHRPNEGRAPVKRACGARSLRFQVSPSVSVVKIVPR